MQYISSEIIAFCGVFRFPDEQNRKFPLVNFMELRSVSLLERVMPPSLVADSWVFNLFRSSILFHGQSHLMTPLWDMPHDLCCTRENNIFFLFRLGIECPAYIAGLPTHIGESVQDLRHRRFSRNQLSSISDSQRSSTWDESLSVVDVSVAREFQSLQFARPTNF